VTIVSEDSPYSGQSGRARRVFWRERTPWVVVRLCIGGMIAVRWDWTDLPVPQLERDPSPKQRPTVLLSPSALRDLVRFLRSHCTKRSKKNIFMIKWFIVFLEVIAFVCISSQFAAVRTLLPSHRRNGADAGSARANEVGEASIVRFIPPASRRGITEGWELSLPPQRPVWLFDDQPKRLHGFDSSSQAAPHALRGEPLSCGIEGPPRCWNPRHAHNPAVTQTGQTIDPPGAAFVGANRLFAGLVLLQVRPRDRSAVAPKQRISSSRNLNPGPVSVPAPDAGSVFTPGSERSLTVAQAASPGPPLAPIEALLAELARRRLRSLAAKKRA